ncbi:metal-dependent hydrolase [Halocatena pleomorpha]|uniref:Metal-dependent hydrolase n=1 Tax=Halocatena pleomorpha TaxID=1785090 RepID=A0A3P3RCX2_9EURY|nr:metal-dependent hydrolase [Halocatena pleomorpha]RRJ30560.1 metal-dependent hydrolase [Halocatena pleomorpha]
MWPWGHAAFGYLLYSFGSRLFGRTPQGYPVIVLLIGTQLPDLVDKTLSWVLELFPQGYSVAHSVFVAVPFGVLVVACAVWRRRTRYGLAFLLGYWSHIVGDLLFGLFSGNPYTFARVMWPVVTLPPYTTDLSGLARVEAYIISFLNFFADEGVTAVLVLLAVYFGPVMLAFLVWLFDGAPGVSEVRRLLTPSN